MRGASAIEQILTERRDQPIRVLVVWEPVLPTDWLAPGTMALARVADARARQYWDWNRLLSKSMGEHDRRSIVWDHVAVYPPGVSWVASPPEPVYQGHPVVRVTGPLMQALDQFTAPARAAIQTPRR